MKTHTLAALLATTLLLFGCCPKAQTPQYITTEGTRLIKDGEHIDKLRTHLGRKTYALSLTTRQ